MLERYKSTGAISDISDSPTLKYDSVVTDDADEPDERKPDTAEFSYDVPQNHPRRIILPSLGVDGFVQQVGITEDNAIAVPSNIHVGGWFRDSKLPGSEGLSIIDGHVGGRYSDGIFFGLGSLVIGDVFQIEYGDLSVKTFEIMDRQQIAEKDSASFLFEKNPDIDFQLNLITCGGNFDNADQQYVDRVIVVSRLVSSE